VSGFVVNTLLLRGMTNSRPTTYGDHAEIAASAMTRLIADQSLPSNPDDVDLMLRFRDMVVDSYRQRLFDLGALPRVDRAVEGIKGWAPFRDEQIPLELSAIASALPRLQDVDGPAPTDVTARRSNSLTVELWRTVAVESLAASNALSAHASQLTTREPETRWLVLRDLAVGLETMTLLDDQMREVGLLNQHDAPRPMGSVEDTRAVLAHAARVANWRATSDAADHMTARPSPDPTVDARQNGPVQIIRSVSDLAPAQVRLARALTPMATQNSAYAGEPHISAQTARLVTAGQLFVAQVSHQATARAPGGREILPGIEQRIDRLSEVDRHLAYLVDDDPDLRTAGTLPHWQQTEITTSIQRMLRRGRELGSLTARDADALEDASRAACRQFATVLRRELVRDDSNLRIADPSQQVGATRVHRASPLGRALTDLVNSSQPVGPATTTVGVQRAVLQHTVDTTPAYTTRQTAVRHSPAQSR
jgi:hypothetical protein